MVAGDAMTFPTTEIILSVLPPNLSQLRVHCRRDQMRPDAT
jgi:hypothetical protein